MNMRDPRTPRRRGEAGLFRLMVLLPVLAAIVLLGRPAFAHPPAPKGGATGAPAAGPGDSVPASPGQAAGEPTTPEAAAAEAREPLDDSVPRGAVRAYLEACRAADFERAARYLDLRGLPDAQLAIEGPTLARHLKVVLDQRLWIDLPALSADPEGTPDDGLRRDLDRIGAISARRGDVEVLLERMREDGRRVWRFSARTVNRIPDLYAEFGYGPLGEILPEAMFTIRFLEIDLWQWIGLVLLAVAAYAVAALVTYVVDRVAKRLAARTATDLDDMVLQATSGPIRLIVAVLLFKAGSLPLRLAVPARGFLGGLEKAVLIAAVAWLTLRLVDVFSERMRVRFESEARRSAAAVVPLGRRAMKAVLGFMAVIALLQNVGFNVTGVLATVGVGGIAIALAAQKTIENLFGGLALIVDQPVRVGDQCRYGDRIGTVEDVGLRSTRIRSPERSIVTVPNAEFAQAQIESLAMRDRMRLYTILGLRCETSSDQLRHVLVALRRILRAHPRLAADPPHVRFVGFGAHSLDVEVLAYVATRDPEEFLTIREDIYLRFMDAVAASGTGFAFPSSTTYLARDGGMDAEATKAAEGEVARWRTAGTLPFPEFTEKEIAAMDDTLDYPPRGSALSAGRRA